MLSKEKKVLPNMLLTSSFISQGIEHAFNRN